MKKLAVCLVIILALVCAGAVYADTSSIVGQAVQGVFPVVVNGQTLSTQAIVINGVSYLPTRAVSDALGATVSFQNGQIDVTTVSNSSNPGTVSNTQATQSNDNQPILCAATITFTNLDIPGGPGRSAELLNGQWYINKGAFGKYFNPQTKQITLPNGNSVNVTNSGWVNLANLDLTATVVSSNIGTQSEIDTGATVVLTIQ